jgi:hypothetical protein
MKDGELSDHLLPVRGFSVDDLEEMDKEKALRDKELAERKANDELERKMLEQKQNKTRLAAEAMIPSITAVPINGKANLISELNLLTNPIPTTQSFDIPSKLEGSTVPTVTGESVSSFLQFLPELEGTLTGLGILDISSSRTTGGNNSSSFSPNDRENSDRLSPLTSTGENMKLQLGQLLDDEARLQELGTETKYDPNEQQTLEEYSKQVQEILEKEEEELLETVAILNAPPGADTLDMPEKEDETSSATSYKIETVDELAILEMDELLEDTGVSDEKVDDAATAKAN